MQKPQKDGHYLRRNSQENLDTAMSDSNLGKFKARMNNMADQINFYLYLNAALSPELFGAWKLAHIYPVKVLLTYSIVQLKNLYWVMSFVLC